MNLISQKVALVGVAAVSVLGVAAPLVAQVATATPASATTCYVYIGQWAGGGMNPFGRHFAHGRSQYGTYRDYDISYASYVRFSPGHVIGYQGCSGGGSW